MPGYFFEGECREYLAELRGMWNGRIGASRPQRSARIARWKRKLEEGTWLLETIRKREPVDAVIAEPVSAIAAGVPAGDDGGVAATSPSPIVEAASSPPEGPRGETPRELPAAGTPQLRQEPLDPWPAARQRDVQQLHFQPDGTCGGNTAVPATFWEVVEEAGGPCLRLYGREGMSTLSAQLRAAPDGSWKGKSRNGATPTSLRLHRLTGLYPSAGIGVSAVGKNGGTKASRKVHAFCSARGIGDHIAALYACVGAANRGMRVTFHTRHPDWLERVRHGGVEITGELPARLERAIDLNHDSGSQLRHGRSNAAWYADAIAPALLPARPESVERTMRMPRFDFDRYVVVAPFSAWARRDWPGANWTRLTHLLREAGYEVVAIGVAKDAARFDKVFGQTTALWAIEHPPEWVADAMLGAACVIGNDSGMTHYAELLDVPTLAIHAHLPPEFLWAQTRVRSIAPKTNCTFCRWQHDRGYNSACDAACSALGTIGPEDVLQAFQELVKHPNLRPMKSDLGFRHPNPSRR